MLLFITWRKRINTKRKCVSIHQMLLFIAMSAIDFDALSEFQYIKCYSLSLTQNTLIVGMVKVSIHQMLLFICMQRSRRYHYHWVSIHQMLLFIHLTVNILLFVMHVSIHQMLLFIFWAGWLFWHSLRVSIHQMLLFIGDKVTFASGRY